MIKKRKPRAAIAGLAGTLAAVSALVAPRAALAVSSAELYDPTPYRYGRFEARLQFAAPDGVVSSFFLWKLGSELAGAYWNELDFEKIGGDCALQLNSIYGAPMAGHASLVSGVSGLCAGYHTYAFEWTPDYVAWSVDGAEKRRDTGAASQAYADNAAAGMQLRFNIWPGTAAFGGTLAPASLPVYQFISWVAYSEYTPGAGDGGGNFALRWRESFENGLPATWAKGSWASPLQQSTHAPANATASAGVAVLALTADDAPGFTGTPPIDPGDTPSERSDGGAASGAGGTSGATGSGGSAGQQATGGSGCGCGVSGYARGPFGRGHGLLLAMALLAIRVRRRR